MHDPLPEPRSDLAELTDLSLPELLAADESALAHSLRRIRREIEQPEEAVAGFQNSLI